MKVVILLVVVCAVVGFADSNWRQDVRSARRQAEYQARMARAEARMAVRRAQREVRQDARLAAREWRNRAL